MCQMCVLFVEPKEQYMSFLILLWKYHTHKKGAFCIYIMLLSKATYKWGQRKQSIVAFKTKLKTYRKLKAKTL